LGQQGSNEDSHEGKDRDPLQSILHLVEISNIELQRLWHSVNSNGRLVSQQISESFNEHGFWTGDPNGIGMTRR